MVCIIDKEAAHAFACAQRVDRLCRMWWHLEEAVKLSGWRYDEAAEEWRLNDNGNGPEAVAEDLHEVFGRLLEV